MNAFKSIIIIVLFMVVFTMLMLPIENGWFPSWVDADLIQFMLLLLCVACVIVLIKR